MHPLDPRATGVRTFDDALSSLLAEARIRHRALCKLNELAELNRESDWMERRWRESADFHRLTVGAPRINILDPLHLIPEIDRARPRGCYRERIEAP